ncbi:hypothetical protein ACQEV2_00275 [Streptomyces sp. CA-251387]|uniref:hypothetical protein n=1 Tax=Streptomyces sp. CA-251387 TaxID=3240064 RepID=UPI003D8B451D
MLIVINHPTMPSAVASTMRRPVAIGPGPGAEGIQMALAREDRVRITDRSAKAGFGTLTVLDFPVGVAVSPTGGIPT